MKKLFTILFLTFFTGNLFGQNNLKATKNSFPTNLYKENFKAIKQFDGKVVAFHGVIEKIENSRNNTPFYKLGLGNNEHLWTVLIKKLLAKNSIAAHHYKKNPA